MGTMALASGGRSTLNPNAPLFIPAALQQVEDFSPQWWELVKTSKWFHDYWVHQHQEQESFDGDDEDEDIANLLPESFDLGIEEEFSNLLIDPTLSAEPEEPITDMPQEERPHSGTESIKTLTLTLSLKCPKGGACLSLKSPKGGGVQSRAETPKYWEKPAQHVSPRCATRRIHQPR